MYLNTQSLYSLESRVRVTAITNINVFVFFVYFAFVFIYCSHVCAVCCCLGGWFAWGRYTENFLISKCKFEPYYLFFSRKSRNNSVLFNEMCYENYVSQIFVVRQWSTRCVCMCVCVGRTQLYYNFPKNLTIVCMRIKLETNMKNRNDGLVTYIYYYVLQNSSRNKTVYTE